MRTGARTFEFFEDGGTIFLPSPRALRHSFAIAALAFALTASHGLHQGAINSVVEHAVAARALNAEDLSRPAPKVLPPDTSNMFVSYDSPGMYELLEQYDQTAASQRAVPVPSASVTEDKPLSLSERITAKIGPVTADEGGHKSRLREAITMAAKKFGVSAPLMLEIAEQESSFDERAASRWSSARGLFQFTENTWLRLFSVFSRYHQYKDLAGMIRIDRSGPEVEDSLFREVILDLRYDPAMSATLAGALLSDNKYRLRSNLGREVDDTDIYIAHVFGVNGATALLRTARKHPSWRADKLLPLAARSNKSLFFDGKRPRSAEEMVEVLSRKLVQAGERVRADIARYERDQVADAGYDTMTP